MRAYAWMALLGVGVLALASCSGLKKSDSRGEAEGRWSQVRSRLKYQLAADSFAVGQLDAASEHVKEAIGLDPNSAEAYILLAKILLERGEIASAAEALEEARSRGNDSAELYYIKGVIAQRYARFEEALSCYTQASKLEPMNAHYVAAVAETLVALNRAAEALALVRERWTDFEQNATLRALAGEVYMMFGRYEEAAETFREAARIAPEDKMLKRQLGLALALSDRFEEARDTLVLATNEAEEVPSSILLALGRCQLKLGQYTEAKDVFRRAVESTPNNPRSWSWLAQAALLCDDLMTARRSAMHAEQLDPTNVEYAMLLGYVCWRQQDFPAAVEALKKALKTSPDEPMALYLLGQSYQGIGQGESRLP